jgi:hypothetical protein
VIAGVASMVVVGWVRDHAGLGRAGLGRAGVHHAGADARADASPATQTIDAWCQAVDTWLQAGPDAGSLGAELLAALIDEAPAADAQVNERLERLANLAYLPEALRAQARAKLR